MTAAKATHEQAHACPDQVHQGCEDAGQHRLCGRRRTLMGRCHLGTKDLQRPPRALEAAAVAAEADYTDGRQVDTSNETGTRHDTTGRHDEKEKIVIVNEDANCKPAAE